MRRHTLRALLAALILAASGSAAIGQSSPEQKTLGYLTGQWRLEVAISASPMGPAGTASGTEECELFANRHMVCRADTTGASGHYQAMRVLSYVPAQKHYAAYTVDSLGFASLGAGQIQANTWTFTTDAGASKLRLVMKTAADSYTAVSEFGGADGKWMTIFEVKATRVK